ncbi:MAG TPA: hypothetical protein PKK50_05990 [Myxococcota bacterium]|nr:hypothetical protein [Myxococcota bacterium]HNZ03674.1 hypothetical protein [Myxococcota bacterium]
MTTFKSLVLESIGLMAVVLMAGCGNTAQTDVLQGEVRNDHGSADTEIVDSAATDNAAGLDSETVGEDAKIRSIGKLKIVDRNSTPLGTIPVTGGAAVPILEFLPWVVEFDFQLPADNKPRYVTIRNRGMFAFSLTGMSIDCSGYLGVDCQREFCPVSVELQDVSFSDGPILLEPNEFISGTVYLNVLPGPGCTNGDVVVKLETDIRTDPYEFYVYIN